MGKRKYEQVNMSGALSEREHHKQIRHMQIATTMSSPGFWKAQREAHKAYKAARKTERNANEGTGGTLGTGGNGNKRIGYTLSENVPEEKALLEELDKAKEKIKEAEAEGKVAILNIQAFATAKLAKAAAKEQQKKEKK